LQPGKKKGRHRCKPLKVWDLHRDLKPGNVMVANRAEVPREERKWYG
jgi:hypothetical protein